jgi:hypothetical protein
MAQSKVTDGEVETSDGVMDLASLAAIVAGLAQTVERIAARPQQVIPNGPEQLPRAKSTKDILTGMKKGESRSGQDRTDPFGAPAAFMPDQIVILTDPDKIAAWRNAGKAVDGEPIYAVVKSFMYRRSKDGFRKYKVDFGLGMGEDGLMEYQMEAYVE